MKLQFASSRRHLSGMTLAEVMVGFGVGGLILMVMGLIFISSLRSFADIGNYMVMDQGSRSALDRMTRDIRRAKNLTVYSSSGLTFDFDGAGTSLYYTFNSAAGTLSEFKTGGTTNVLLKGCDSLAFTMYKNVPLAGGTNDVTTTPAQGKAISVAWRCSRTVIGKKLSTEDMQQALIVIRNKAVN
ncbi:MAG: hypothetical protein EPO07_11115 [Verrucomicrobia bacterium]|nr:MAG: hypothetical protein EPO07_11115 [Verrucomicrobiota bacterium]